MLSFLFETEAARLERMKQAEEALCHCAKTYSINDNDDDVHLTAFDTMLSNRDGHHYLHAIKVEKKKHASPTTTNSPPLVFLHGYMNGALNFYRCLYPLAQQQNFSQAGVYSVDLLGWGLSSRPNFPTWKKNIKRAEQFFVESLEEWRQQVGLEKMILAGHSMGGYLSVAYAEQYPERVDSLLLLSPVGVPEETPPPSTTTTTTTTTTTRNRSWSSWALRNLIRQFYHWGLTPATLIRWLPNGKSWVQTYVQKRLPSIVDPTEQEALTNYLYYNSLLKPSGANALQSLLTERAFAKDPLIHRIPLLQVPKVAFFYGAHDWMDVTTGGQAVQDLCCSSSSTTSSTKKCPKVSVHVVSNAGHLLMMENPVELQRLMMVALLQQSTAI